jgi:nicotinate-nucleotide adenylyltransferase
VSAPRRRARAHLGLAGSAGAKHVGTSVKIGFLGGSFDPVHLGHLMAAQDAFELMGLDRLVFVPAAQAPLKAGPRAPAADRVAMLRAAVGGDARFEVSEFETAKGGVSYTIDTVRHFRRLHPADGLFWVIGDDQVKRLGEWREIGELSKLVEFIAVGRPGHESAAPPGIPDLRIHRCAGHMIEASSTELRGKIARGLATDSYIPVKTIIYISEKGLYRGQG